MTKPDAATWSVLGSACVVGVWLFVGMTTTPLTPVDAATASEQAVAARRDENNTLIKADRLDVAAVRAAADPEEAAVVGSASDAPSHVAVPTPARATSGPSSGQASTQNWGDANAQAIAPAAPPRRPPPAAGQLARVQPAKAPAAKAQPLKPQTPLAKAQPAKTRLAQTTPGRNPHTQAMAHARPPSPLPTRTAGNTRSCASDNPFTSFLRSLNFSPRCDG